MNDNHANDYAEEEGQRRHAKRIERALINNDPFYPNELHEQDVRGRFEPEEKTKCEECGSELSKDDEYHVQYGTCNSYCYGKMVGVYVHQY